MKRYITQRTVHNENEGEVAEAIITYDPQGGDEYILIASGDGEILLEPDALAEFIVALEDFLEEIK